MNKKLQIFIVLVLILNSLAIWHLLLSQNQTQTSGYQGMANDSDSKNITVKQPLNKYEQMKKAEPYSFMTDEEIVKFDCSSLKWDDLQKCEEHKNNVVIGNAFINVKTENIKNVDCSQFKDEKLFKGCTDLKEFLTKEINNTSKIKRRTTVKTNSGASR